MVKLEIPLFSGCKISETTSEKTITVRTTANDGVSCIIPYTLVGSQIPNKTIFKSIVLNKMEVNPNQDLHFIYPEELIVENRYVNGICYHIGSYVLLCRQMILSYLKKLHLRFQTILPPYFPVIIRNNVIEYGIITKFFETGVEMKCIDSDLTFYVSNEEFKGSKVFSSEEELLNNHRSFIEEMDILPGDYSTFGGMYRRKITSILYNIDDMTNRKAIFDNDFRTKFHVDDLMNIERSTRPPTPPKARIKIHKNCDKRYSFCFFTRDQLSVIGCLINDFTITLEIIDPEFSTLIMARNRDEIQDESYSPDQKRSRYT